MNNKLLTLLWILPLLAACSSDEKPAEKPKSPWDDQLKVLEQTKQMDQQVEENAQRQREEMERQGL